MTNVTKKAKTTTYRIDEIKNNTALFYDNDFYINNTDKLVAIHRKDRSTAHKIKEGYTLCSFRMENGSGGQWQENIKNETLLTTVR